MLTIQLSRVSILALTLLAGSASGQLLSSGFVHSSCGGSSLEVVAPRSVHASSSDQQVCAEVQFQTSLGGECDVSLPQLLTAPPGSELRMLHKGWDGTVKGVHALRAQATFSDGSCDVRETCDFSALGAQDVEISVVDGSGTVHRFRAGSAIAQVRCIYPPVDPTSPPVASLGAGKVSLSDFTYYPPVKSVVHRTSQPRSLTVMAMDASGTIVGQTISDAYGLFFRPICIVAPCPGDWVDLSTVQFEGIGFSSLDVNNAACSWSFGASNPTSIGSSGLSAGRVLVHADGGTLQEQVHPDSDADGWGDAVDAVATFPAGTPGTVVCDLSPPLPPQVSLRVGWDLKKGTKRKARNGVDMLVQGRFNPALGCAVSLQVDASSMGATSVMVHGLDDAGNYLGAVEVTSSLDVIRCCEDCDDTDDTAFRCDWSWGATNPTTGIMGSGGGAGKVSMQDFHFTIRSSGAAISNVRTMVFEPLNPVIDFGDTSAVEFSSSGGGPGGGPIVIKRIRVAPPEAPGCDSIDFNNDTSFFDPQDIEAFLSVYGEGPCVPELASCGDIDFNNDTSLFDPCDISSFLTMYGEGPCTPCGQ